MPVEFIGFIGNHNSSEIIPRSGPVVDPDYIGTVAKAHEYAGFDRALLAFHADAPDPLVIGQYAASVTERLESSSPTGLVSWRRPCSRVSSRRSTSFRKAACLST
jgi:alkanesulfonate monooxygenase SsuD/methylene tetrahydromethanopterin reductase-like flavin-dependent oxidoreductase (luciferase family)